MDTPTTDIYTLSLHAALPILRSPCPECDACVMRASWGHGKIAARELPAPAAAGGSAPAALRLDRKSTRLNSSHANISYAVFCLKKNHKGYEHYSIVLHLPNKS